MASFFSGLLASLKVTFFAPARSEGPLSTTEVHKNDMPSFGLPSLDESVNDHSKMEKTEQASSNELVQEAQSVEQPTAEVTSGDVSPHAQCPTPDSVDCHLLSASAVLDQLQSDISHEESLPLLSADASTAEFVEHEKAIAQCQSEVSTDVVVHSEDPTVPPEVITEVSEDQRSSSVVVTELEPDVDVAAEEGVVLAVEEPVFEHQSSAVKPIIEQETPSEERATEQQKLAEDHDQKAAEDPVTDQQTSYEEPVIEHQKSPEESTTDQTTSAVESVGDNQESTGEPVINNQEAASESVIDHHLDHQANVAQITGAEAPPLVHDNNCSLDEEYGSPMIVDEPNGPNLVESLMNQPPLPQPVFVESNQAPSAAPEIPQSPTMTNDSFTSAKSSGMPDFNASVEPMDVDSVGDATATVVESQSDTSGVGSTEGENLDEVAPQPPPQNNMSAEGPEPVQAPIPPPVALGDNTIEEKPLKGKSSYEIDWSKFDENTIPNPFGVRPTENGKARAPVKRPVKKSTQPTETKTDTTEPSAGAPPPSHPAAAPSADNNANELKSAESSANTQQTVVVKTEDDVKNSNVLSGDTPNMDQAPSSQNKENASTRNTSNKAPRTSTQQTAVVAPTVHVAAAVGSGNEVDNASAASRPLRRPPIKTNASVNATVQQTVPVPAQHNRHTSPKGARSGDESISEEEMFVMASSDPFNDSAAFEFLNQAGGARGIADTNLARQSLYQNFDPLVGSEGAAASVVSETKRRQNRSPVAGITDEVISVGDITFSEKDELLLINTPSPMRDQSRSDDSSAAPSAPSTVVKKKHGPKVQSGVSDNLARGDAVDADRLLSITPDQKSSSSVASSSGHDVKMQFQALLMAKEKEFSLRLEEEKLKRMQLEMELGSVKKEAEVAKQNASEMSFVVAEYEKTVRQLIAEKDKPKQNRLSGEFELVQKERDQALEDLQTVENAFSELNRRYETLRSSAAEFKKNEEVLKGSLAEYQHKLKKSEEKFHKLYAHAEHKLELANQEIERLQKAKETDTLALRAALKKRELQVETLEKNLEQKQKEIQELTAICDELIQKAGGH